MSITKITPRMQHALESGKRLRFFADIDLDVKTALLDTEDDFLASESAVNMDFTGKPGYARLSKSATAYDINQATGTSTLAVNSSELGVGYDACYGLYSFLVSPGRTLGKVTVKRDGAGLGATGRLEVWIVRGVCPDYSWFKPDSRRGMDSESINGWMTANLVTAMAASVTAGAAAAEQDFSPAVDLADGWYSIVVSGTKGINVYYSATDTYAGGSLKYFTSPGYVMPVVFRPGLLMDNKPYEQATWTGVTGDLYFKLALSGYNHTGSFVSKLLDMGSMPTGTGTFKQSVDIPAGTSLSVTLYGYSTRAQADAGTPAVTMTDVEDGQELAAYQYWRVKVDMAADAVLSQTPLYNWAEITFPVTNISLCEKVKLNHVADDIRAYFRPLLKPLQFTMSSISIIDRISTGGSINMEIEDSRPDVIQQLLSNYTLKNYRINIYLGADVPGFQRSDLLRFFVGIVDGADIKPKFRGMTYGAAFTARNPIMELKQKAPLPDQTGLLDFETIAINLGTHVTDAMVALQRSYGRVAGRYVNIESFTSARSTIGEEVLVRASNDVILYRDGSTAPDTRRKTPDQISTHLKPLLVIADGYLVEDESSRITFILHNPDAEAEAFLADEKMVRDGEVSAVPIQSIDSVLLGYTDLLFNVCYTGCEWDGAGDNWSAFDYVYGSANSTSANAMGPDGVPHLSVMEANMVEVSKWLGPEHLYNGETLARRIGGRMVNRFGFPPFRLMGVVVPVSQFMRTLGSVVRIASREVVKYGMKQIGPETVKKCMVIGKRYNQRDNTVSLDLMELTS